MLKCIHMKPKTKIAKILESVLIQFLYIVHNYCLVYCFVSMISINSWQNIFFVITIPHPDAFFNINVKNHKPSLKLYLPSMIIASIWQVGSCEKYTNREKIPDLQFKYMLKV